MSSVAITVGSALLLPLVATAQFFSDPNAVSVCNHDSPDCRPVTSGELFAAISIFTFWPWMIVFVFVLYKASDGNCASCTCPIGCTNSRTPDGVHGAADVGTSGGPGELDSRSGARSRPSSPTSRVAVRGVAGRASGSGSAEDSPTSGSAAASSAPGGGVRPASSTSKGDEVEAGTADGSTAAKATDFGMARSTSLASSSGAARFVTGDASPSHPFSALGGSMSLSRGTVLVATSRLAALGVSAAISAAAKVRWEVELLNNPTGPLCIGLISNKRRPVSEARGELVGMPEGSWAFDVAAGNSLAETEHSGIPPLETFAAKRGSCGDRFGVELDRVARKMTLYKNSEPLRVELQDLPEDGLVYPALSISGGTQVRLRLGHGWGILGTMTGATSMPLGNLIAEGTADV